MTATEAKPRRWLWLLMLSAAAGCAAGPVREPTVSDRARKWIVAGQRFSQKGRPDRALRILNKAVELSLGVDDLATAADAVSERGALAYGQGRFSTARRDFLQALAWYRQAGNSRGQAMALSNLGLTAVAEGHPDGARKYFERALALDGRTGDRATRAVHLNNMALAWMRQRRGEQAEPLLREALQINRELGSELGQAANLNNLGRIAQQRGDSGTAMKRFGEALGLAHNHEAAMLLSSILGNMARALQQGEHWTQARACYERALAVNRHLGNVNRYRWCVRHLIEVCGRMGDPPAVDRYRRLLSRTAAPAQTQPAPATQPS